MYMILRIIQKSCTAWMYCTCVHDWHSQSAGNYVQRTLHTPLTADFVLVYQVKEEGEDDVETTRRDTFLKSCKEVYGLEFESEVCTGEGKGSWHIQ